MTKRMRMFVRLVNKSSKSNIPQTMDRPRWSRSVAIKVPRPYSLEFCRWGWMKSEVYKERVNTRDELVAPIMNIAALLKQERQDDLKRATSATAKRIEKCIEVMVGF